MKLVGEYELTEQGVKIVGKINNSHIHEVRQLLTPFKTVRIHCGSASDTTRTYSVPHTSYRFYIVRNVPGICTPETERAYVSLPEVVSNELEVYYADANTFAGNMGVMYGEGDGRQIMDQRRIYQYGSKRRSGLRLLTNSAWVWTADERGNFEVEINGLVNRHMMTVLLSNATKLAKYIDNVLVRALDRPDEFTPNKIEARASRQVNFSTFSWR